MLLKDALGLRLNKRRLIALVGGGGKTTTLFKLASEYKEAGKSVLVTTTTAIYKPETQQYDRLILTEDRAVLSEDHPNGGLGITVVGRGVNEEGKLLGIDSAMVNFLHLQGSYDVILIEADGAKKRPLKAPAEHEPVIPQMTGDVIGLIGLEALGGRITQELVHRPQLFAEVVGSQLDAVIDGETLKALILHQQGLFKGTPIGADRYLILNKLDLLGENQLKELKALEGLEAHLREILITSYNKSSISKWRDIID